MLIEDFDKIFCINLEKRKDRKSQCDEIFDRYNLQVEYVKAFDGSQIVDTKGLKPGAAGCCMSHQYIYKKMKENNYKSILILEDDVEFHTNFKKLFNEYYKYVPENWNLLFFGGSHNEEPKKINEYVHKLKKTFTTHCYAVKDIALNSLLEQFDDKNIFNLPADVHLYKIQKKIPCYGFCHHIAWQREGWSDIEEGHRSYDFLK
jgi:GR25 family glycosyltransferase involved in LPS biosynthesis